MCGICGMLRLNEAPVDLGLLRRMTAVLSHRESDDEGFLVDRGLGLGFRPLSIIDLTGGRHPMFNEDQPVTVVFNGEIYNFVELLAELRQQGHTFRTSSDTEVIVHGFEAWGDDVVRHLNGMFAFAAWDNRRKKLLLDRPQRGFNPPVEFWLQHHLVDYAQEHHLMETLAATGYFKLATVREMAEAHLQGRGEGPS
jgi:asparagine synthase (glutamine-hydrolysing)